VKFSILADENVDHRVVHTLRNLGHVVDHVDFVSTLGKGSTDEDIAAYSRQHD
jgi:predicted nuclease of predicted toxin-antitoxin system